MAYNVDLMRKVRHIVRAHPDRHDQNVWFAGKFGALTGAAVEKLRKYAFLPMPEVQAMPDGYCGTTACVAGWAAILSAPSGTTLAGATRLVLPDGEVVSVEDYAAEQLGIGYHESSRLFSVYAPREEVLEILDGMIEAGS